MTNNSNNHDACNPTDFMMKVDCERIHDEREKSEAALLEQRNHTRDQVFKELGTVWAAIDGIRTDIACLIRKVSSRTIITLVGMVCLLIGFIVVNIILPNRSNGDLDTIKEVLSSMSAIQQYHEGISKDNKADLNETKRRLEAIEKAIKNIK